MKKRLTDVRVEVTHLLFGEWPALRIRKGTVLEGYLDEKGHFWTPKSDHPRYSDIEIFPTHFKVLGKYYFRAAR